MSKARFEKSGLGRNVFVPAGEERCTMCDGDGRLFGMSPCGRAEVSCECPTCCGCGHVQTSALGEDEELEMLLQASVAVVRGRKSAA